MSDMLMVNGHDDVVYLDKPTSRQSSICMYVKYVQSHSNCTTSHDRVYNAVYNVFYYYDTFIISDVIPFCVLRKLRQSEKSEKQFGIELCPFLVTRKLEHCV